MDTNKTAPSAPEDKSIVKKPVPTFPLRRPGPPSRGPIMGRGKGGGVGNKGRIGMRTGTR